MGPGTELIRLAGKQMVSVNNCCLQFSNSIAGFFILSECLKFVNPVL